VGELSATYPIVFEKSPAFVVKSRLLTPGVPQIATGTAPSQAPPPEPPPPPRVPQVNLPAIPAPPAIPSIDAAAPPEPQPPAPPAPPPPSQQPAALDLSVAPPGISISTPTALIQPPTPPVNPAPPGGARKEARQRQAAAQKGGADSSEEGGAEGAEPRGDTMADAPYSGGSAMTRHDAPSPARQDHAFTRWAPGRAEPSFSVLPRRTAATASQGALPAVGGLTLAALTLALGFTTLRPGSRRRSPEVPAPARAFGREHRR
jgi:hypothetical protein